MEGISNAMSINLKEGIEKSSKEKIAKILKMGEPDTNESMMEEDQHQELGRGKRQRKQRITTDYEYYFGDFGNIVSKGNESHIENGGKNLGNDKTIGAKNGNGDGNKSGCAAGNGASRANKSSLLLMNIGQKHARLMRTVSAPSPATTKFYKKHSKFSPLKQNGKPVLHIHRTFRDDQGREYNQTEVVEDARLVQNYLKMRILCGHEQLCQFAFDSDEAIKDFKLLRRNMLKRFEYHGKKVQMVKKEQQPGSGKRVRFADDAEIDEGLGSGTSTSGIVF